MKKQQNKKTSAIGVRASGLGRAIVHSTLAAMWACDASEARSNSAAGYHTLMGKNKTGKERVGGAAAMVLGAVAGERYSAWSGDHARKAHEAWKSVFDGQKRW